jgi:asparagine synthase (glutamine-hydrolysing)
VCGIAGLLETGSNSRTSLIGLAVAMANSIAHRGPDGSGTWADEEAGVVLAHRRLAVIDLSSAGAQPMASPCGRFVLSFNGEIYSFKELRKKLEQSGRAPPWRGGSDTEVLLASLIAFGVSECLPQLDGMFAFAFWDSDRRALTIARDRFGEKPLYYGARDGRFAFGSELRALLPALSLSDNDIDAESVEWLLRYLYIPAPKSIFRDVFKLPPACSLVITAEHLRAGRLPDPLPYWSSSQAARRSLERPFEGTFEDAVEETERLLMKSVRSRLVSDVPVGAMLSGGIDSTCVAALAQHSMPHAIRTFTVSIEGKGFDESAEAEVTARFIGSEHNTIHVGDLEASGAAHSFINRLDEPFADSSQIVTQIVSRALREQVTVALSGDGGDEFFGGYTRYSMGPRLWKTLRSIPAPARAAANALIRMFGPHRVAAALRGVSQHLSAGDARLRVEKALRCLPAATPAALFEILLTTTDNAEKLLRHLGALPAPRLPTLGTTGDACFMRQMMAHDTENYLPNDILTKVDRASMSVGLEARSPFLQPDLHAFAWTLPPTFLLRDGRGKAPLRAIAARYAPSGVSSRPKQGFSIPLDAWLRGSLRDWASDLLSSSQLHQSEFIDGSLARKSWGRHLNGEDMAARLWPVLVFEAWRASLRASKVISEQV